MSSMASRMDTWDSESKNVIKTKQQEANDPQITISLLQDHHLRKLMCSTLLHNYLLIYFITLIYYFLQKSSLKM